jgi:hypothetical protein
MEEERSAFTCAVSDDITTLSVTIGEGQLGATFVFRGDEILVQGGVAIGQLNLGRGDGLVGSKISVESLVNDVVSENNRMSVRYVVHNGTSETVFVARHNVAAARDMCRFVSDIEFAARKP